MIIGIFWMLVANAAAFLGAHALWTRLQTGQPALDLVVLLLLRLGLISAAVLLAGMLGFLSAPGIGVIGAIALAVLLATGQQRAVKAPVLPDVGLFAGVLGALVVARLVAQVWFFAPYFGDAISYHLPKVAEWVRAGAFTREMGVDSHVSFPAGFELIETWWVVFIRHDVIIEMAGLEFLLLGAASTYAVARQVGLEAKGAFVGALAYSLTPVLQLQATACLNDGPTAGMILATAALIAGAAPPALILMAAGMGCGIKPVFAYALPGLILLFLTTRRSGDPRLPGILRPTLAALGCGIGGFWYLRNLLWYHNPIYPIGSGRELQPNSIQYGPNLRSLRLTLADLVNSRIYDDASAYGAITHKIAGWGVVAFAIGCPCLIAMLRGEPRVRRIALGLVVSLISIFIFVQYDPWSLRFVAFFPALLAIAAAWAAAKSRTLGALLGLALALQFVATTFPREVPFPVFRELVGQPWRSRSMSVVFGIDIPDEKVGYVVDNRNQAYLLYRPDFSRRVVYLRATTASELRTSMDREHLDFIYASCVSLEGGKMIREAEREELIQNVNGNVYARPRIVQRLNR